MQPFARETVSDRRQPYIRWTAVFAGATVAAGLWMLLQLLLTGGALSAIDPDEVENVRAFGIGTTLGSVLAPLIAMFVGGLLAGRLAAHYDKKVAGLHGALVWAITSLLGIVLLANAMSSIASHANTDVRASSAMASEPGARDFVEQQLGVVNQRLESQGAPQISLNEMVDAAHDAGKAGGTIDRATFVAKLDDKTKLSRPEAEAAVGHFGDRSSDVIAASHQLAVQREHALEAADRTGKAMLTAGVGLLICLGLAIFGAIIGARRPGRGGGSDDRRRGEGRGGETLPGASGASMPGSQNLGATGPISVSPGVTVGSGGTHTTAPYPTTAPIATATDPYGPAPTVTGDPSVRRDPRDR
ncbi:MAG: hypothetical protein M3680_30325 [Myxococcota bacterium]|nr:hypothetical protein [Myxococcota bacterium]